RPADAIAKNTLEIRRRGLFHRRGHCVTQGSHTWVAIPERRTGWPDDGRIAESDRNRIRLATPERAFPTGNRHVIVVGIFGIVEPAGMGCKLTYGDQPLLRVVTPFGDILRRRIFQMN